MKRIFKTALAGLLLLTATPSTATKVLGLKVIDSQYLMVHFRDGEVHYRDDGTGPSAYLSGRSVLLTTRALPPHNH